MSSPRVSFETLGCRSNAADTVSLQMLLLQRGGMPIPSGEVADVYVVNTCVVTDTAEHEVFKILRRIKNRAPQARVVVTGCMANVGQEQLLKSGLVDAVVKPRAPENVIKAIYGEPLEADESEDSGAYSSDYLQLANNHLLSNQLCNDIVAPGEHIGHVKQRARFHLRVQDGCNNSCTYCIVPRARGKSRSQSISSVISEISRLKEIGYGEVVICGTSLGCFGLDTGETLIDLMRALCVFNPTQKGNNTSFRIRVSSLNPDDVSSELIDIISDNIVFCEHIHMCVQSFNDNTLSRMNRQYRLNTINKVINNIHTKMPRCGLGTDIIAGFPGETKQDVLSAQALFKEYPFTYLHVFPYSERSQTPAECFGDQISREERANRAKIWRELGIACKEKFHNALIGSELEVVVETSDGNGVYTGTSREFVSACIDTRKMSNVTPFVVGHMIKVHAVSIDNKKARIICQ